MKKYVNEKNALFIIMFTLFILSILSDDIYNLMLYIEVALTFFPKEFGLISYSLVYYN